MLAPDTEDQLDRTPYPSEGLRVGINFHSQTLGKHRIRFSMETGIANIMRRGLEYPRVHFDGDLVNGLRIWCEEEGGMAPTASYTGAWSVTVPVRRLRGREQHIGAMDVAFEWERDDTGPVMIVPRLPDALLPEAVIDKLPNSKVDPETRMERADRKLRKEWGKLGTGIDEGVSFEAPHVPLTPEQIAQPEPEPEESEPDGEPTHLANIEAIENAPNRHEVDLKDALAMVNEIIDRLGDGVVLSIDENGHVRAKRRIVQYIDL
jgi:hypothetical protein